MSTVPPVIITPPDKGVVPGKKIKSFIWMVLAVNFTMYVGAKVAAPEMVSTNALWIIGFGGLVTIGGQSLVDTVAKWAESKKP